MNEREKGAASQAMVVHHEGILDIEPGRARANLRAIKEFQAVVREVLVDGQDYGIIPGTQKPTLYKPGAEKITKLLNLCEDYEFIERVEDWDRPLFHYIVRCTLSDIATGTKVASGLGECNSRESRYRYRWIREDQLTDAEKSGAKKKGGKVTLFEPEFAIQKKETTGKYGKPIEHWAAFDEAIKNRTARSVMKKTQAGRDMPGYEMDVDTTLYQVENPDIFDVVNTMVKIAKKRSHVDATLSAARLSELFTQDLEDFADVAGAGMEPPAQPQATPPPAAKAPDKEQEKYEADKKKPLGRPKDEFDPGDEGWPPDEDPEGAPAVKQHLPGVGHDPDLDLREEAKSGDQPKGDITMQQMEKFAKMKTELATLGISEQVLWKGIARFTADTLKKAVVELGDFTAAEYNVVHGYLCRWRGKLVGDKEKAEKAAKEAAK